MKTQTALLCLLAACLLLACVPGVLAEEDQSASVIYQTTFSTDPKWVTNNPSTDYWDANAGMYHFAIEPSTGSYAYIPVNYDRGSFKLEYDVILNRIDEGATFRLGFSGVEMDGTKGPNVLTMFTNAKFGKIMWLHLVTPGNKLMEVNSQRGDTLTSGPLAYDGPTVKYEINKTYHVTVNYDSTSKVLSMKVNEKPSGKDVWSYFINTGEELRGMNRIYLGSKGDYGMMGIYAIGYIDNVRLTTPAKVTPATTAATVVETPSTTNPTPKPTTAKPIGTVPPSPPETPESPVSPVVSLAALGIGAACAGYITLRRRN